METINCPFCGGEMKMETIDKEPIGYIIGGGTRVLTFMEYFCPTCSATGEFTVVNDEE